MFNVRYVVSQFDRFLNPIVKIIIKLATLNLFRAVELQTFRIFHVARKILSTLTVVVNDETRIPRNY